MWMRLKMAGRTCTSEWLRDHLESALPSVLILDCRPHAEYSQKGHIMSAINVSLPALMLKRLINGSLSVPAVIKCPQARDIFLQHWKSDWICLYDDLSPGADDDDNSNRICKIFGDKLAAEGCRVVYLEGGYKRFGQSFPELCIHVDDQSSHDDKAVVGLRNLQISNSSSSDADLNDCDSGFSKESDGTNRDGWHSVELFKILDYLYLGNAETAQDLNTLQEYNIRYILNVTPNLPNVFETKTELGFKYMQIPIQDCLGENLAAYFDDAIEFIEEAHRNQRGCLVHCRAGISRSVTVTVAYLMHKFSVPLNRAYNFVKRKKTNVSPNFNFMGQLLEFERRLNLSACRNVPQSADEGVIPWTPEEESSSPLACSSVLTDSSSVLQP
ncbi:dual specificity protein phosphatase 6-like [Paramacrobiotus metropolitanus]|uniref:dual specificity protein phosphatase 6-like n=1 Tax=Paramacrobiotus metropolitanus TaxID=2943436 RepID=UPI002445BC6B|nr:dual specificity protein phosphatase 6-like [Paramacrobiotus metropolitanus]XP_055353780.1 dual specificity protein phosphatase 6-like [Paramacrobiotus metropolitanus]XP_055353781.1 dual specificity protein phosphatase 6-like [Paramacrobiotus metropolitanus]